jgi:membrane fusion protein (multidrug efflux system)
MGSSWVVSEGLNPGDRIVTVGLQKASPGATVTPEDQAATAPFDTKTE